MVCERTKEEVLARELCIQHWYGMHTIDRNFFQANDVRGYVEANWPRFHNTAKRVLETLEKHK